MRNFTENLNLSKSKKMDDIWNYRHCLYIHTYLVPFHDLGFVKYIKMYREYNRMSADIRRLREENIQIREEVKSLKTDPDYIEAYAREKLGLAKEGEFN